MSDSENHDSLMAQATPSEPWHDEDRLRELYHGERMTQAEVAAELGCGRSTVGEWMQKLGVTASHRHSLQEPDEVILMYLKNELEDSLNDTLYIKPRQIPFDAYRVTRRGKALSRLSRRDDLDIEVKKWGGKAPQTWMIQWSDSDE